MTRSADWSRRALRRCALLALALLALGAGAHFAHHLLDPACEGTGPGVPHACLTCQALHGGVLSTPAAPVLTAAPFVALALPLPEIAAPAGIPVGSCAARAPPLS